MFAMDSDKSSSSPALKEKSADTTSTDISNSTSTKSESALPTTSTPGTSSSSSSLQFSPSTTLLLHLLNRYPVIESLVRNLHHSELINFMLSCKDVHTTVLESYRAVSRASCGGEGPREVHFACWCCGVKVCHDCSLDVFLPIFFSTSKASTFPTAEDRLYNDKTLRNPAADYDLRKSRQCCYTCARKPIWWIQDTYQKRFEMGFPVRKGATNEGPGWIAALYQPKDEWRNTIARELREELQTIGAAGTVTGVGGAGRGRGGIARGRGGTRGRGNIPTVRGG